MSTIVTNDEPAITITPAMIEAAARVYAHREEYNEKHWPKYAATTEAMLRAALAVAPGTTT